MLNVSELKKGDVIEHPALLYCGADTYKLAVIRQVRGDGAVLWDVIASDRRVSKYRRFRHPCEHWRKVE